MWNDRRNKNSELEDKLLEIIQIENHREET